MLFEDLGVGPACGTIELRDDRGRLRSHRVRDLVQPDLIDAVFVAVQREQAAIAELADAGKRIEYAVGRESAYGAPFVSSKLPPCTDRLKGAVAGR